MRIVTAILLLLAGGGLIAYSYIGAFITLAGEVEQALYGDTPMSAFTKILSYINSGEIPQLMNFMYGGLFLIVIAIVMLTGLIGRKRTREDYE